MKLEVLQVTRPEFEAQVGPHFLSVFGRKLPRDEENRVYFLIQLQSQLCGWHIGTWLDPQTFEMTNSAILPEYRRQGVYRHWVHHLAQTIEAQGGRWLVSRHRPDNLPILESKRSLGFEKYGEEDDPQFGRLLLYRAPLPLVSPGA